MNVSAYLQFDGQCEDAFAFYAKTFGGEVIALLRWSEMPGDAMPAGSVSPELAQKIMHSEIRIGATTLMGADPPPGHYSKPCGVGVTLTVESDAEAEGIFTTLCAGGSVGMPTGETFFAHRFGMVTDRYGIPWMIVHRKH
ncbi:MAG: VOC family protein [Acidibrevibacterium sp.]|uniref:VOC family protein n=1 Tax=Acidibrevibacterium sp. TaxID=2606776 RepID=UPI003D04CC9F